MTRADKILILLLLALGALSIPLCASLAGEKGTRCSITVDGRLYGIYTLDEDRVIEIREQGRNVVEINDGRVRMQEADCYDKPDVRQGYIDRAGQVIICLPNKVVVKILDGRPPIDAVSY